MDRAFYIGAGSRRTSVAGGMPLIGWAGWHKKGDEKMFGYKPEKMPEGKNEGFIFSYASGRQLDVFGKWVNVPRRKFWVFKEPSFLYKIRLRNEGIRREREVISAQHRTAK